MGHDPKCGLEKFPWNREVEEKIINEFSYIQMQYDYFNFRATYDLGVSSGVALPKCLNPTGLKGTISKGRLKCTQ